MHSYFIEQKVRTIAQLYKTQEIEGYAFDGWSGRDYRKQTHWTAGKQIVAENGNEALHAFYDGLRPILDALSVVTRCAIWFGGESLLVRRIDYPDGVFFVRLFDRTDSVPITFHSDEQTRDVARLLDADGLRGALHYMRAANDTHTAKTRISMLVIAAEALAGTKSRLSVCSCGGTKCADCGAERSSGGVDHDRLSSILGKEVYKALYRGRSLRNKMFHGATVSDTDLEGLDERMYQSLLTHVTERFGLEIRTDAVRGAPRTFYGRIAANPMYLAPSDSRIWSLTDVEKHYEPPAITTKELRQLREDPSDY